MQMHLFIFSNKSLPTLPISALYKVIIDAVIVANLYSTFCRETHHICSSHFFHCNCNLQTFEALFEIQGHQVIQEHYVKSKELSEA